MAGETCGGNQSGLCSRHVCVVLVGDAPCYDAMRDYDVASDIGATLRPIIHQTRRGSTNLNYTKIHGNKIRYYIFLFLYTACSRYFYENVRHGCLESRVLLKEGATGVHYKLFLHYSTRKVSHTYTLRTTRHQYNCMQTSCNLKWYNRSYKIIQFSTNLK